MRIAGTLSGGAHLKKSYKIGASFATLGVPTRSSVVAGISPGSTTAFTDTLGLTADTGTYSTTQGDAEGVVSVYIRPDAIFEARVSGGATANTALTILTNSAASAGGTLITDAANVPAADMTSGTVFCLTGANQGLSRVITTHTASTSFTVTVPFPNAIAVSDTFLFVPYSMQGTGAAGADGPRNLQGTTNVDQANGAIASGTGGRVCVYDVLFDTSTTTKVQFLLIDHIYGVDTLA